MRGNNETMKIVLASSNKHKISELRAILSTVFDGEMIEVITLKEAGINTEIEENGSTFGENALIKASVAASTGMIGVADDSGLVVDALGGEPGIYSARYAGEHGNDKANNEKLLKNLEGETDRRAHFVCSIACAFPDGREPIVVNGQIDGEILHSERGEGGFGYDPLFWVESHGKSFAEMTAEEKNAISHRAKALRAFSVRFKEVMFNK